MANKNKTAAFVCVWLFGAASVLNVIERDAMTMAAGRKKAQKLCFVCVCVW